jgi:hypothetical protein
MRTKIVGLFVTVALLIVPSLKGEGSFTNQDVVKLVAAHLSDTLIIAKIREAPRVEFALETDELVALQKAGVSEKIIQAMLERKSGSAWSPGGSDSRGPNPTHEDTWASMQEDLGAPELIKVALRSNNETARIRIQ